MEYKIFKNILAPYKFTGPAIGWFCTYTPEEVIHAAGFNAYGIRKSSGYENDDVHLGRNLCSYVHSVFGGALNGKYDFLDGVVIAHCCECMRRMYDGWVMLKDSISPSFAYQLDVPSVKTEPSIEFFEKNIKRFITTIEKQFDKKITEKALIASIGIFNTTRDLLGRLNRLRMRSNPPVSGTMVDEILDLCMSTPKEIFNDIFEPFLVSLEQSDKGVFDDFRNRIMVYGGMFNPEIVRYVERKETAGIVVCEDACNGIRYYDGAVDLSTGEDPVLALSRRYLGKMPCPRIAGDQYGEKMPKDVLALAKDFNVDGVIYYVTKRCENLYWEYPFIKEKLYENNITIKRLEGDMSGDIRKREIKSFIELIDF